jgi:WhiB family redox-sensing transcriptional regulator
MTQILGSANPDVRTPPSRGPAAAKGGTTVRTFSRTFEWDDSAWRTQAACRNSKPELFFPVGSTGVAVEEINSAKQVCHACPVREQCLQFALLTNQESGIWGGTSEDERRRLRKRWLAHRRQSLVMP